MTDGSAVTLEPGTNLLHIGPAKTGSTALQLALHRARETLRAHGVVYPGPGSKPAAAARTELGFFDSDDAAQTDTMAGDAAEEVRRRSSSAWQDLVRQVEQAREHRVCVSLEAFGRATDEQAARIVDELGGDRPHVVAVARRLDRLLPSQWQQRVKFRECRSYETWLAEVLAGDDSSTVLAEGFALPHDTAGLVARWGSLVGRENVTLVVSDDQDRALVPRAFEQLLGAPEGTLDANRGRTNRSLTYDEVEVVRGLNIRFADNGWTDADHNRLVTRGVVRSFVRSPAPEGDARIPELPAWARARVAELSVANVAAVQESGIRIIGDIDSLRVPDVPGSTPADPGGVPRVSLETALRAAEALATGALPQRKETQRQQ